MFKKLSPFVLALCILAGADVGVGQVPQLINYQGVLTDGSGNPIDGTRSIQFTIYDAPAAGTPLWSETQSINVQKGLFGVLLGSLSPIPFKVFKGAEAYLALKVEDDPEMTPRKRLVSVAYSYRSNDADHVNGKDIPAIVSSVDSVVNDGGNIDLVAGDNIIITPDNANDRITISATGGGSGDISAVNAGYGLTGGGTEGGVTLDIGQGRGLNVLNDDVSLDTAYTDSRYVNERQENSVSNAMIRNNAVTADKILPNVVSRLNGVSNDGGNIDLVPGSNITITPDDVNDRITISASDGGGGSITSVNAGAGLSGGGSSGDVALAIADSGVSTVMIANGTILGEDINTSTTINAAKLQGGGTTGGDAGVYGESSSGRGVWGTSSSSSGIGVYGGNSSSGYAIYGSSSSGSGVLGYSSSGIGVRGFKTGGGDYAGFFSGNVQISGTLTKTAGSFKIDHPLDPANKYLQHSFVESPDMKNVYDGIAVLNSNGEAVVEMPAWFEALNQDFRYQLTAIGAPGPNLFISEKISNNRFRISGGISGMEVSWLVTGIRHDPYADAHRIQVEEEKTGDERGKYLQPREYGQPESMGIGYEERQKMSAEGGQP